jgi:hypothetical protein
LTEGSTVLDWLLIISALCSPFVPWAAGVTPRRPRRTSTPKPVGAGKHRWLNPAQASAVEAAVARVVTADPQYSGNTLQLPCRECGRRAVPPVDHLDSPPMPCEKTALVPLGPGRWVITAVCMACAGPLISRVLDDEYAAVELRRGAINGAAAEAELAEVLATL